MNVSFTIVTPDPCDLTLSGVTASFQTFSVTLPCTGCNFDALVQISLGDFVCRLWEQCDGKMINTAFACKHTQLALL